MYYTYEQEKEILFQIKIKKLKLNIRQILKEFTDKEINLGILSVSEQDNAKRLYSNVIAKLNETFYEMNITDMKDYIRKNNIQIPNNDIINLMDNNHLYYYKSILNKYYKSISNAKSLNLNFCMSLANDIGTKAYSYFINKNNETPLENYMKIALEQKNKQVKESQKSVEIQTLKSINKKLKEEITSMKKTMQREREKI